MKTAQTTGRTEPRKTLREEIADRAYELYLTRHGLNDRLQAQREFDRRPRLGVRNILHRIEDGDRRRR